MRAAKIQRGGQTACALVVGDAVCRVGPWCAGDPLDTPFPLAGETLEALERAARHPLEVLERRDIRFAAPISPTSKLICLGLNYREHADEAAAAVGANPGLFVKLPDALVGHEDAVVRPRVSASFDYEGEIAVVIGRRGRHIARADALSYLFGYTIMLDGSVRDFQQHSLSAGKCFWRSGALGPWIVTSDEIPDPARMSLMTRLNGEVVQSTTADLMIHDIPSAIAYISRWTWLAPGDVISMGTPAGVGALRDPPLWLKPGDALQVTVSAVGELANTVCDESGLPAGVGA